MKTNKLIKLGLAMLLAGTISKSAMSDSINVGINYSPRNFSITNVRNEGKNDENTQWRLYVGPNWEDFSYPDARQDKELNIEYKRDFKSELTDSLKARLNLMLPTGSLTVYSKDYIYPASGSYEFDMDKTEKLDVSEYSISILGEKKIANKCNLEFGLDLVCDTFDYSMSEETNEIMGLYSLNTKDTSKTNEGGVIPYLAFAINQELSKNVSIRLLVNLLVGDQSRKQLSKTIYTTTTEDFDTSDGVTGTVTNGSYAPDSSPYVNYSQSRVGFNVTYSFGLPKKEKSELDKLIEKDDYEGVKEYLKKNLNNLSEQDKIKLKKYSAEHKKKSQN